MIDVLFDRFFVKVLHFALKFCIFAVINYNDFKDYENYNYQRRKK